MPTRPGGSSCSRAPCPPCQCLGWSPGRARLLRWTTGQGPEPQGRAAWPPAGAWRSFENWGLSERAGLGVDYLKYGLRPSHGHTGTSLSSVQRTGHNPSRRPPERPG